MTPKAENFIKALRALCLTHGVMLTTEAYEGLQIWDLLPQDTSNPIHVPDIEDMTNATISEAE